MEKFNIFKFYKTTSFFAHALWHILSFAKERMQRKATARN